MSNLDETFSEMSNSTKNTIISMPQKQLNFEEVFSIEHLYKSGRKCLQGVRWKASTQNIEYKLLSIVCKLQNELFSNTFKSNGFREFTLFERGKKRRILSVNIEERIVQKCLCDYCLVPILTKSFIYDNGSCIKGKGLSFTLKRIKTHLHKYFKLYGVNGYIILFDIKSFFDSIDRNILLKQVEKKIEDKRLFNLYAYFINRFPNEKGIGLGSQVSEISALQYLNDFDHTIKDKESVKFYARYMDDGYCICRSKEEAKQIIMKIKEELQKVNLQLHENKTTIIPLNVEFIFLKRKFKLCDNGKLKVSPHKSTILRYKRKRKKLSKMNKYEEIKIIDTCFEGYMKEFAI